MPNLEIKDNDLAPLKSTVVVLTGGSSGIGLATTKLLLSLGAKVVVGDVNECPVSSESLTFQKVDVRDWKSQLQLFKKAIEVHGRIDHAFANAGITSMANYVDDKLDDNGDLLPPDSRTLDINLTGVIYTCKLGIHYIKKHGGKGSVCITASPAGLTPFALTDYNVSKHAVIGLMRGLNANLIPVQSPIRVNCIAPLWTETGMVPKKLMEDLSVATQSPDVVARSAALCMADESRNGSVLFSVRGQYSDIGEELIGAARGLMKGVEGKDMPSSDQVRDRMNGELRG